MGEVISLADYRERRDSEPAPINNTELRRRIADIAIEIVLLQSEKDRLESRLLPGPEPAA